jgi:hypothetical protein
LWNPKTKAFHFWKEIKGDYELEEGEKIIWERIIDSLLKEWTHRFIEGIEKPKDKKWVGFFQFVHQLPLFVCQASSEFGPTYKCKVSLGGLLPKFTIFLVSAQTHFLLKCCNLMLMNGNGTVKLLNYNSKNGCSNG